MNHVTNRNLIILLTLVLVFFAGMMIHSVLRGVAADWFWYEWVIMLAHVVLPLVGIVLAARVEEVK